MSKTKMKKFIGSIKKPSKSEERSQSVNNAGPLHAPQGDHPEAVVVREVVAFCEAGAPGSASAGDEYLHLPAIVDAAEGSPSAAREAANILRRYFSKEHYPRGYAQYNAVMVLRILTDNPGRPFTQNFDKSFISTLKELLRSCPDANVQQIMRETLDYFEGDKLKTNDSLTPLIEMWRKEKGRHGAITSRVRLDPSDVDHQYPNAHQAPYGYQRSAFQPVQQQQRPSRYQLPPPEVLAEQIEQAKTSARLLVQMVQSTPAAELGTSDLVKEFADRVKQANRAMERYMACENPHPDENTMLTLIETNEQLQIATSKHQRAVLGARRANSATNTPPAQPQQQQQDPFSMVSMNNNLPAPMQPMQNNRYQQPQSPPMPTSPYNNEGYAPPPGPPRNQETFAPPPGPPPQNKPVNYARPTTPPGSGAQNPPVSPQATRDYGVSENPFTDDAYGAPEPPRQEATSYSLFNRAAGQMRDAPDTEASNPGTDHAQRPGPHAYNSSWQPTPSFIHRQDSSTNHITMSGASPERR